MIVYLAYAAALVLPTAFVSYWVGVGHTEDRADTWTCGDCGNKYDHTVQYCPNTVADQAAVQLAREAMQ